MRFAELVDTARKVGATSSRLEKIRLLADVLRRMTAEEVAVAVPFMTGEPRQGKVGVGGATLRRAAASAAPSATLDIVDVDRGFAEVAAARGAGSSTGRVERFRALLERATADEQDFLFRLGVGELRHGALEGVVVEAVAAAFGVSAADVRRAVMMAGDVGAVAAALAQSGPAALARFAVTLFTPVQPMLADTAADLGAALARLGEASLETKLDGARVQVHKSGDDVAVFSRRLHDVTARVPEVVEAVRALPARELVLDGETIALAAGGRPHPFQVTMRRFGRRLDVERMRAELPLAAAFFDALWLDGESLLDRPETERWSALAGVVPETLRIPRLVTADVPEASRFLEAALGSGHEGIMAKALGAPYQAGRRGSGWLKVKPAHTLDLVVLAAEWGHGRRRGWLSNLHLGARDPRTGAFVMLGKTFKGMTDAMLAWQTERLLSLEVARDEWTVHVRPELVVEVAFNDVQESSQYPGGVALRFARVKAYRPDKKPEDADTIDHVRSLREGV